MNINTLTQIINDTTQKNNFSGVVSLSNGENTLFCEAFGYRDRANKIKNSVSTRFCIASGTKFLTALAIFQLIEAGKLSLGDTVKKVIKTEIPGYSDEITIGHLLTHTSGIPDYFDEEEVEDFDSFMLDTPNYLLKGPKDYIRSFPDKEMKFQPGEQFSYCNSGFIILGIIIEDITGISYREYIEKQILKPCGMSESGFFSLDCLPGNTAIGYVGDRDSLKTNIYNLPIIGASDGGLYATAADIQKLWCNFLGNKIVSEENKKLMVNPFVQAASEGENFYYGQGIWIYQEKDHPPVNYIVGCDAGVSFTSNYITWKDLILTVFSNTTEGVWDITEDITGYIEQ